MSNEVTGYTIIENGDTQLIERDVKARIADGWVPSGPLIIHDNQLMQVMVKFGSR